MISMAGLAIQILAWRGDPSPHMGGQGSNEAYTTKIRDKQSKKPKKNALAEVVLSSRSGKVRIIGEDSNILVLVSIKIISTLHPLTRYH